jgi:predicted permease
MSLWNRLVGTFRGDAKSEEISGEMRFHLDMRIDEYIAQGLTPAEARRKAQVKFGNRASLQDETRDRDTFAWLDILLRESRHALRNLRRRPSFTLIAILSLAIGIGANTAIFSMVDAVILKPLPFESAKRIFGMEERKGATPSGGNPQRVLDYASQVHSFDSIAGFYSDSLILSTGDREKINSLRFFGDLPKVLRIRPELGRAFDAAELRGEGAPVALISRRLWQRRFGSNPDLTGLKLETRQGVFEVVGVLPATAIYPEDVDLWSPDQKFRAASRKASWLSVVARLKEGIFQQQANSELRVVTNQLARQYPESDKDLTANLLPLNDLIAGEAKAPILFLMGTVALVLLIACVNLAGLLLARAIERQREATIRAAIGAGRGSLVRLFLIESLLLSLGGALLGLLLAANTLEFLKRAIPLDVPRLREASIDPRVLMFTLALSIACGLFFGCLPAWRASRVSFAAGLRDRSPGSSNKTWIRSGLTTAQVALSMLLLILTGLLTRGFLNLRARPLGFAADQVVTLQAPFSWDTPSSAIAAFTNQALQKLQELPGVRAVGVADRVPLTGGTQSSKEIRFLKHVAPEAALQQEYGYRGVSPGYFQTMSIPLRSGRLFDEWRGSATPKQIVVNETFARRYFGDENPLGQQVSFERNTQKEAAPVWWEIVGVVGGVPAVASESKPRAEVFTNIQAVGWPLLTFTIRTNGDPGALIATARKTLMDLDPSLLPEARLMTGVVEQTWQQPALMLGLVSGFSICALLLALIGVYGILASDVTARTQEFGVRMALGADKREILWMALRRGLRIAAVGIAIGLSLAFAISGKVGNLLFAVSPRDTVAFGGALVLLSAAASLACYLPARRAASVDPVVALRHE